MGLGGYFRDSPGRLGRHSGKHRADRERGRLRHSEHHQQPCSRGSCPAATRRTRRMASSCPSRRKERSMHSRRLAGVFTSATGTIPDWMLYGGARPARTAGVEEISYGIRQGKHGSNFRHALSVARSLGQPFGYYFKSGFPLPPHQHEPADAPGQPWRLILGWPISRVSTTGASRTRSTETGSSAVNGFPPRRQAAQSGSRAPSPIASTGQTGSMNFTPQTCFPRTLCAEHIPASRALRSFVPGRAGESPRYVSSQDGRPQTS